MLTAGWLHPGARAFVDEYLGTAGREVPFAGREAELSLLGAWWGEGPATAVVSAPAGMGKSALVLRLASGLDEAGVAVAWVPISLRFGTHRSATVEALLAERLRRLGAGPEHWRDALGQRTEPLLVALDGLDELHDEGLLEQLVGLVPGPGIKLLVAARSGPRGWAERLGWSDALAVPLGALGLHEVTALLSGRGLGGQALEVMRRTGGDPLLVRLCAEALAQGQPLPEASQDGLVAAWWQGQREALPGAGGEGLLCALGSAQGAAPWPVLAAVLGQDEQDVRRAAQAAGRFVVESDEGVALSHPRFAQVVRERWPEQVRRCDQRFAEIAERERRGDAPLPYWLHFALPHLHAAGADGEAVHRLITPASLDAWRRSEGSGAGFLRELAAAQALSERALAGPLHEAELRRLARYRALGDELQLAQRQRPPGLRAALVRHGLLDLRAALSEALADTTDHEQQQALSPLLPLLPDALLPGLAEHKLPRAARAQVAGRLLACGAAQDAARLLREAAGVASEELLRCAPLLPPEVVEELRLAEIEAQDDDPLDRVTARLALLPLVPSARRLDELRAIEAQVEALTLDDLFYDAAYARDARSLLAEALAGAGQADAALRWLARLRSQPAPFRGASDAWWPDDVVRAHARAAEALDEPWRGEALALLAGLPGERRVGPAGWIELTAALPGRIDEAWSQIVVDDPGSLLQILRSERSPSALRERASAQALALARASLAEITESDSSLRFRHAPGALAGVAAGPLSDAVLELIAAWIEPLRAGAPGHLRALAWLAARHGQGLRAPRAAEALRRLAELDVEVWEVEGWERVVPFGERRALLERGLRAPLRLWTWRWLDRFSRSIPQIEPITERAADRLRAALRRMAGSDPFSLAKVLPALRPAEQEAAAQELLARLAPPRNPPRRNEPAMLAEAAAGASDPELRRRLALAAWRWSGESRHFARPLRWRERVLPFFPEEAAWKKEGFFRTLASTEDPLDQAYHLWWPSHDIADTDELRRGWMRALMDALKAGGERGQRAWNAASSAAIDLDAPALLRVVELLPQEAFRTVEYLSYRAFSMLEAGGDPALELVIERGIESLRTRNEDYATRMRLELLRLRRQSLAKPAMLREALARAGEPRPEAWSHGWVADAMARSGLAGAAVEHIASLRSPAERLAAWAAHWPNLTPEEQAALVPRLLAAYAEGGSLWQPFAERLPAEALRLHWERKYRGDAWWESSLELLQRLGGAPLVEAWIDGTLEALGWFAGP